MDWCTGGVDTAVEGSNAVASPDGESDRGVGPARENVVTDSNDPAELVECGLLAAVEPAAEVWQKSRKEREKKKEERHREKENWNREREKEGIEGRRG